MPIGVYKAEREFCTMINSLLCAFDSSYPSAQIITDYDEAMSLLKPRFYI